MTAPPGWCSVHYEAHPTCIEPPPAEPGPGYSPPPLSIEAQVAEDHEARQRQRNMTAAHISDARRQMSQGKPVANTTIRGLIEAAMETMR